MLRIYRPTPPIHWDFLILRGPDAADFMHRLTTINVRTLQAGEGSPGFFLTPQGRIRAYFTLWRMAADEFCVELDAGAAGHWKAAFQEFVEQFHFGEKFTLEGAPAGNPERACAWVFGDESESIVPSLRCRQLDEGVSVFNHGALDYGNPWLTAWGAQFPLENWIRSLGAELIGFEQVERMRIAKARPRIDAELTHDTIPLDAGLRDAIAENKGCYPGQEVIEKIISLGSPARRLVKLEGSGSAPAAGQPILAPPASEGKDQELGKVTSVIASGAGRGFSALGFVKKTHAREGTDVRIGDIGPARIVLVP